jgi:hypothetical protein
MIGSAKIYQVKKFSVGKSNLEHCFRKSFSLDREINNSLDRTVGRKARGNEIDIMAGVCKMESEGKLPHCHSI